MNYNEALNLFGFINNFTKEELKKRYLELSKKYHPDLNGDEEMMKKINSAYEVLKSHKVSSKSTVNDELMKKYNDLKEKLKFYTSKTVYLPDTLEFKYANAIDNVIKTFTLEKTIQLIELIDFKYYITNGAIKDLFESYRNEILKNGDKSRRVLSYYNKEFLDKNMYVCLALAIVSYSLWCVDPSTISRIGNDYLFWTIPIVMVILQLYSLDIEGNSYGDPIEVILSDKKLIIVSIFYIVVIGGLLYVL